MVEKTGKKGFAQFFLLIMSASQKNDVAHGPLDLNFYLTACTTSARQCPHGSRVRQCWAPLRRHSRMWEIDR